MTDLQRRVRQTILLLTTLLDHYPAPATWTGNLVARSTLPGPSPSRWQRCGECDGAGRMFDRFKRDRQCETCNGHGRYKIDDYTGDRVGTLEAGLVTRTTTVRCDRCNGEGAWKFQRCELCEGTGRRNVTPRELDAAHDKKKKQTLDLWGHDGSYHELDHELQTLKTINSHAHRQVWTVYVTQTLPYSSSDVDILQGTVTFISYRMPNPIIIPAGVALADKRAHDHLLKLKGKGVDPRARALRDQEIRKLIRQGKPVQWVAQQTGLSTSSVYEITKAA